MTSELWRRSAAELVRMYRSGKTTPTAALESVVTRHAEVNPDLNAVVTLDREGATEARRRKQQALG